MIRRKRINGKQLQQGIQPQSYSWHDISPPSWEVARTWQDRVGTYYVEMVNLKRMAELTLARRLRLSAIKSLANGRLGQRIT